MNSELPKEPALYCQVMDLIRQSIEEQTLKSGDKLPSLRRMSSRLGVSIPTVRHAYIELERQRQVVSRPKSGFFVRDLKSNPLVRPATTFKRNVKPQPVQTRPLIDRVYDGLNRPDLVPLGIANPSMALPAAKTLHRTMKRVMTQAEARSLSYSNTLGEPELRRQIAYRYFDHTGVSVNPQEICITNGGQEALLLALKAVAKTGDVVAVESPTYHGLLELIGSLGMLAIEVETCPTEGITLSAMQKTLETHDVKVCMLSTTLSNPLGVTMPAEHRATLVAMIEKYNSYLIEDDVYGELRFDGVRETPAFGYATGDNVLTCGSFSKTAAPGYRVGWLVAGSHIEKVGQLKRAFSCSSGLLQQLTLSDFLASGNYDRHLRKLRPVLRLNADRMRAMVAREFPEQTRTSCPAGGSVLWLELPAEVDAENLFDSAMNAGISIAPGNIFSSRERFNNFVRLSFGHPWSEEIERSLQWLGRSVG